MAIYHNWQTSPNSGWAGAYELGGSVFDQIAVGQNLDGRLEIFYPNDGHVICHNWQTSPNSGWGGENVLGGSAYSQLCVGQNEDGRLEIFYVGLDNVIYHNWQTSPNSGWSGQAALGGENYSGGGYGEIEVGQNADGRLEIFYVGRTGSIYHNWQTAPNSGWSGGAYLGGMTASNEVGTLAVARNTDGRLEIFYPGTNGHIYHNWQTSANNGWSGENELGGASYGPIAVAPGVNPNGGLEIYYVGATDLRLYNNWQTKTGWNGENLIGGYPKSVAAGRNADGRLEVFYVSSMDGRIYHNWQIAPGSGWVGENQLGGDGDLQIAVAENADGRLEIFYRKTI